MAKWLWRIQASFYHCFRRNPLSAYILGRENDQLVRFLKQLDGHNIRWVLDLGAGGGNSLTLLQNFKLTRLVAVDDSWQMLSSSRSQFPAFHYVQSAAQKLPFRPSSIQLITAIGLSEYIGDLKHFLQEAQTVLSPEGYLILTIAPPSLLNYIRFLIGHRLFLRREADIPAQLLNTSFRIQASGRTLLQYQYLLRKM